MVQYLNKTLLQGFIVLIAVTIAMIIVKVDLSDGFEWQISKIGIYIFILLNQFLGFRYEDWKNYAVMSLLILLALSIDLIILATLFSGIQITEIQNSASGFLFPLVSFPFTVLLFRFVRLLMLKFNN